MFGQLFFGRRAEREHPAAECVLPVQIAGQVVRWNIVVGDRSSSMTERGFERDRTKLELMRDAGYIYTDKKGMFCPQDHVAVIGYSTEAVLHCPFLNVRSSRDRILAAFDDVILPPHGRTCLYTGLQVAVDLISSFALEMESTCDETGLPYEVRIIAYSDGHDGAMDRGLFLATQLKAMGSHITTIGIAKDAASVSEHFLRQVATTDGDAIHYYFLGDARAVYDTFEKLATGELIV